MVLSSLEEVRRLRSSTPFRPAVMPSPPLAAANTPAPVPPVRTLHLLPWVLAVVFFLAAVGLGSAWLIAPRSPAPVVVPVAASEPPRAAVPAAPVAASEPQLPAPAAQHRTVDRALADLRSGLATHALLSLRALRTENPRFPSIDYLVALAALQAGDQKEALASIEASLGKKQRVSDALALRASLEAAQESATPGETGVEPLADRTLRQAIQADPANPFPYFELAMRLRARGDQSEAREMLEAASFRLHPVDPHIISEVSLRLMDLENQPDRALPALPEKAASAPDLFAAAYVGFRLGMKERATEFLDQAKTVVSADLFSYLMADPAMRRVVSGPGLAASP